MIWERAQELLKDTLSSGIYNLWIEPLSCLEVSEDAVYLLSPDRYFSAYITQNFLRDIEQQVSAVDPGKRRIVLCENERKNTRPVGIPKGQMRLPHIPENTSKIRALHPR